ncbi:hypothetical protein GCM10022254_36840 [Actinomadura meridiana]|uniref:SDR family oxidoreductase n=1 Tax=Actinomadura meridiana TaxID=559626 RepID=A0ABP8C4U7_9ACTN
MAPSLACCDIPLDDSADKAGQGADIRRRGQLTPVTRRLQPRLEVAEVGGADAPQEGRDPGVLRGDWLRGNPEAEAHAAALHALGRVGRPDDISGVVAFLASDDARWMTGRVVDVSGGAAL